LRRKALPTHALFWRKRITVQLHIEERKLSLVIADAGRGFVPEAILAIQASTGLSGMRERARLLGGDLVVESAPAQAPG